MAFNKRERSLLIIVMLCIGILAGDRLILTPLWNAWSERAERISALEEQLTEDRSLAQRKDSLAATWQDMLDADLPDGTSAAEDAVLKAVSNWSRESRLAVDSLRPSWSTQDKVELPRLDCRLSADGGMSAIAKFVYALEQDPLGIRVEKIELTSLDGAGQNISLDLHFSCLMLEGGNEL
ncbi:hypothetical protein JXA32_14710 [Candidatus Sumerlaeota bacterium]|nr:hypothetical protein [Candidatus Sumerlaeota bacterium]